MAPFFFLPSTLSYRVVCKELQVTVKDANYWRDKYRELLVERDQGRKQDTGDFQKAIALLADALGGLESELANAMAVVLKQAKRNEWGKPGQLALLQESFRQFERRQSVQKERELQAVKAAADALAIPHLANGKALAGKISKLYKQQKHASDWAKLFEALAELQPAGEAPEQPGLMSRLFGHKKAEAEAATENAGEDNQAVLEDASTVQDEAETETAELAEDTEFSPSQESPSPVVDEAVIAHSQRQSLSGHWIAAQDVGLHEPPFSKISDRISTVLGDFLRQIEPPWPAVAEKASAARLRIDGGLNWYELVPTLEDIRDLVMALLVNAKSDYQAYLVGLLDNLNTLLQLTGEAVIDIERDEAGFIASLEDNVGSFSQALQSMNDVAELKTLVQTKVDSLGDILARRKQQNEESGLLTKVQALQTQVAQLQSEAEGRQQELETEKAKARTDALTGLPNREHYNERVHHEVERFKRYQRPLSMAVCDIDHFKSFNDNYSHQAGDRVLKVIGQAIAKKLRDTDFMARYGGEEFVVIMPETNGADCKLKMDRIREAVAGTAFKFKDQALQITFSCGIAEVKGDDTPSTLFARADKKLYDAKDAGRNCCRLAEDEPD